MRTLIRFCLFLILAATARAEIHTEVVTYKQGDTTLEGYLAYDTSVKGKRPGVLVSHQWTGLTAYEKKRAEMLAQMGYVALALDIYGKGVRADNQADAAKLAGQYKSDRPLLRARATAGLDLLINNALVDSKRIAAIGYCFGGTTVLELARSGADVAGVVSFHGGLATPSPQDAKNIKGKVLVCHGADDPFVPLKELNAFEAEMRDAKVDWQLVSYGNSVHGFTMAQAGNDNSKGMAYNEKADQRSWQAMKDFFAEIFK